MLKYQVKKIIFSSTAAVYGEPREIPIKENEPTSPTNPYGESKLAFERILSWYEKTEDLKYVSLRYFNAAGADPEGKIGEDHSPETHLIPLVLFTLLGKSKELEIYGTDYDTPDGTCIRDYIHILDLAEAHILALERLDKGGKSAIYNLGNQRGFSVKEIISVVEEITGKKVPVKEGKRRPGDPPVLIASSEKIKEELGWKPKYPDIHSIISSAWRWHSSHPQGFKSPNILKVSNLSD
jgi:UDP-glucose 4-epimerase